jgi:cytoskeletal protein CcmA (bactofilin family)
MFHQKKPDIQPAHAPAAAPSHIDPARPSSGAGFGAATPSFSAYDRSTPTNHSIVDERLTMKGDLESEGDILIKGKVVGNIRCKLLIIDSEALVEGGIVADEIVVRGRTKGQIQAQRVRLEKTAYVDSEICHQSFSAEEGARIKGALKFMEELPTPAKFVPVAAE